MNGMSTFKFKVGNSTPTVIEDAKLHVAGPAGTIVMFPIILSRGDSVPLSLEAVEDMYSGQAFEMIFDLGDLEGNSEVGCVLYAAAINVPSGTVSVTVKGEGVTDEPQHVFIVEGVGGEEEPAVDCPFSTTMNSEFGMQFGIETSHNLDGVVFAYGDYNHGTITTDVPQDLVGMQMSFDGSKLSVSLETVDLGYGDNDIKVSLSSPGRIADEVYLSRYPDTTEYFGDLTFDNGTGTDYSEVGMCVSVSLAPAIPA